MTLNRPGGVSRHLPARPVRDRVVDSDTGAYERVPGRRLALTGVALLAAAGAVGTFLAAVSVADAAPNTELATTARREGPSSAMAEWVDASASAPGLGTAASGGTADPADPTVPIGQAGPAGAVGLAGIGDSAPARPGNSPPVPARSLEPSMMGAAAEDDRCWWCDPRHDLPDRRSKPDDEPSPTPSPSPSVTATPQPSLSVDLSTPSADG